MTLESKKTWKTGNAIYFMMDDFNFIELSKSDEVAKDVYLDENDMKDVSSEDKQVFLDLVSKTKNTILKMSVVSDEEPAFFIEENGARYWYREDKTFLAKSNELIQFMN